MSNRSRGLVAAAALVLVAGPAAAQSPSPETDVTQTLCVQVTGPSGPIEPGDLLLEGGGLTITVVDPAECAVTAPDDYDSGAYLAYLSRSLQALDEWEGLNSGLERWDGTSAGDRRVNKAANKLTTFARSEVRWLDRNEPGECWADEHGEYRKLWRGYERLGSELKSAIKTFDLDRATDAVSDVSDQWDVLNATDSYC